MFKIPLISTFLQKNREAHEKLVAQYRAEQEKQKAEQEKKYNVYGELCQKQKERVLKSIEPAYKHIEGADAMNHVTLNAYDFYVVNAQGNVLRFTLNSKAAVVKIERI